MESIRLQTARFFSFDECFYTSCNDYDRINLNVGFIIHTQDGEFLSYDETQNRFHVGLKKIFLSLTILKNRCMLHLSLLCLKINNSLKTIKGDLQYDL